MHMCYIYVGDCLNLRSGANLGNPYHFDGKPLLA
jgi:hypothetical protein